ncbi:DNA topoisomerase [Pseudomonas phage vB_PpuM-Aura]
MTKSTSANQKQLKDVVSSPKPFNTKLELYVEDHLYFDTKKPSIKASFSELGLQPFAKAPSKGFIPNLSKLARSTNGPELFQHLGSLTQNLDASQLRLLSVVFNNMAKMEAHGLNFGQKVYVNVSSPRIEFVECYVEAIVIGVESEHPESPVFLSVAFEKMAADAPMCWSMPTSSFLTERQFRLLRKRLRAEGKTSVPDKIRKEHLCWERENFGKPSNRLSVDETVQTIDTVSEDWLNSNVLSLLDPYVDPTALEETEVTDVEVVEEKKARTRGPRNRRAEDKQTLSQTKVKSSGSVKMSNNSISIVH